VEVFNRPVALARQNGDEARLEAAIRDFIARAPSDLDALRNARAGGDATRLADLAADFQKRAEGVGAEGLVALGARIVTACGAGDLAAVEADVERMEIELDWLERVLDADRCSGNL